jgi:DNA-binding response OmpR family regulator
MAKQKILVVDDEPKIVSLVRAYLERDGYVVLTAADGRAAIDAASRERPDLIVLDLMLPQVDGLDVCRQVRRESNVPIVMLTARDEESDKLVGLELGADDYVTKPFSPRELVARIRAVLRRTAAPVAEDRVTVGELVVDARSHEARWGGTPLRLTRTEFGILEVLSGQPGRVFTRLQLLDAVQGEAYEGYERTIDAHVKNLRQKLEPYMREGDCRITTVYGVGYKLEANPNA